MDIRRLGPGEVARATEAGHLFDQLPKPQPVSRFLSEPNSHLFIAYVDGKPVGFVSGVELTHPDKGTEMFLYELAVDEEHRGQGIGKSLVTALRELARERGCYDMWVLTDDDNEAALRTYRTTGADESSEHVMLTWNLKP